MKQTILIQNPAYIKTKYKQLTIMEPKTQKVLGSIPCEDIGFLILEHPQITISLQVIQELQDNKVAIVSCDKFHMPQGLMLPFSGHTQMQAHLKLQIQSSESLKKQLWKQTVEAKINNQMNVLQTLNKPFGQMEDYYNEVKSGDSTNKEGQAANFYWKHLLNNFNRDRYGESPNQFLNYGYSVLRSAVARALVGSGLNPSIGLFHKNKYNAYCLADDIMEPYRPYVDYLVYDTVTSLRSEEPSLTPQAKQKLLQLYSVDIHINGKIKPLLEALKTTSSSLVQCLSQNKRKLIYPKFYVSSEQI